MKHSLTNQNGLSLVEILVALVISLFLLAGIVQVYLGNKTTYTFADASARIQENARFALDIMTKDARLAGFFGCVNIQSNPELVQNHLSFDPAIAAENDLYNFISNPIITINNNAGSNNSDSLTIRGSKPGYVSLTNTLTSSDGSGDISIQNSDLLIDPTDPIDPIILITNCWTSDIFRATAVSATAFEHDAPGSPSAGENTTNTLYGGDIENNLETNYGPNSATAYSLQTVTYSIQTPAGEEPGLFQTVNGGTDQKLIDGIEQMQVMYGLDTDGDGDTNQYVSSNPALTTAQQAQISALRIWLVVRSEQNNLLSTAQKYTVNGTNTTAPDLRMRQVFSVTIDLRNR